MSEHRYSIHAVGTSLKDTEPHRLSKAVATQFGGTHELRFWVDHAVDPMGQFAVRVMPDLDPAQDAVLDAMVTTHQAQYAAHVYVRTQSDGLDDIDFKRLAAELVAALPAAQLRVGTSTEDMRVLVDSAPLDAGDTAILDAAVAAHRAGGGALAKLKERRIARIVGNTGALLAGGFRFEAAAYPFTDYLHRATDPARFVTLDRTATLRLADAARVAVYQAAALAAERQIMQREGTLVQSVIDAATPAAVRAVVDDRGAP